MPEFASWRSFMDRADGARHSSLDTVLRERFGLTDFRPGQREVLDALLGPNAAALAVFPTGGGKSLCYQLPALLLEGITVVVSPLIALMKDQIDALARQGIRAARLDASLSVDDSREVTQALRDGSLKLLYVAPERFNNERFTALLRELRISLFAVDEAHCVSEWGHNFRPDYLKLAKAARDLSAERILALTATATPSVVRDICQGFGIPEENAVVTGFYRQNLTLETTPVHAEARDAFLLGRLGSRAPGPTIVYVTQQKTAERVAAFLATEGLPASAYHAGLEPEVRERVQESWMASANGIVVATIAFGMGIDKADVRAVYHYNLPKGLESYSQEIGRAGRDGAPSVVELFACPDDVPSLENFALGDTPTREAIQSLVTELLGLGPELSVDMFALSTRHDVRPLVLRTALTYLELEGVLRQGTPYYAGYKVQPLMPIDALVGRFQGERVQFLRDVFSQAKKGRTWYSLDPAEVASSLRQPRERVVRAIEYLEEQGLVLLQVSEPRQRFTRLRPQEDAAALTALLHQRFQQREAQEVTRVRDVLKLVTHAGCQSNALVAHFGQRREQPCGHCTFCRTGAAQVLPAVRQRPALPAGLDAAGFRALAAKHPESLGHPRQAARFLCGLSSPALTRAKLGGHKLFGALEGWPFEEVLDFCGRSAVD
ncbi:ATP-dependent DNA helicase, RecQ family [Myxococcus xanthus DK 1622]|uniref:ATP-dependent DNA helicase RecQ n=2 Tax=Myxococcaceae TaxID=31 RepID=Q1D2X3_MYXXD|nr:ATP-dependent DNA helicase, RecQ family [Myxococcus xanthus DK 1622]NOJ52577.1 ATP-dependent DNA helicase RecQ [Myxococcus xanthus]QPM77378.1 ATP-dependent DNA helicase RecQ [Myxococcus xanthus]QVW66445.1 ATP-dependent DNA helicase RecQ [Myxococcus xanthus DZ2]UEO07427.1 RecQ family ATP-dependent DNA helicase [Myxococcus xanthus DZ2]